MILGCMDQNLHIKTQNKINWEGTDVYKKMNSPTKFKKEININDDQLLREGLKEERNLESMSKQDEIIFNILKWIFNAIKKDQEIVGKDQVLDQLRNNSETLRSLGFEGFTDFEESLTKFPTSQENSFTWEEFIDFFLSSSSLGDNQGEWWKTFLNDMDNKEETRKKAELYNSPAQKSQRLNEKAYLRSSDRKRINFEIDDEDEQKLKILTSSRVDNAKKEVEFDTTKGGYDTAADELDIFKNKPK